MRTRAAVLAAVLALPPSAGAMEVAGVSFPRTVQAGGKTLVLNGAGLRTRFLFKVYAIGLYLEHPASDAATILAADEVRRAELHMLRSVSASEMGDAIADAFNANAGSAGPQLKDRLDRFKAMFPNATQGEVITLTYVPGNRHRGRRRRQGPRHHRGQGLRRRAVQRLDRRGRRSTTRSSRRSWPDRAEPVRLRIPSPAAAVIASIRRLRAPSRRRVPCLVGLALRLL